MVMKTMNVDPASSSAARDAIFSQHEALRALLASTVDVANGGINSQRDLESLRGRARELYETLEMHMMFEEQVLPTALRDVIGWGAALQEQIEEDHRRQRATLAVAVSALETDGRGLASRVREFAAALLLDMKTEERGLLQADVDAIASDGEAG
jgi:hypothetical protein